MKTVRNSDPRRSQNILIGLVKNKKENIHEYGRSGSVPLNTYQQQQEEPIRTKSSLGNRLSLFGLPEDTFDRTVIMTDINVFCKKIMVLEQTLSLPCRDIRHIISDMELRALHRQLKKDLNTLKIHEYNREWSASTSNNDTHTNLRRHSQSSQPDLLRQLHSSSVTPSSNYRKHSLAVDVNPQNRNKTRKYSNSDYEVEEIIRHPSVPNLLTQSSQFRSSSALSSSGVASRIPIKSPLTERPLSKMEMRIQRRISCDSNKSNNTPDRLKLLQRKHSIDHDNVINFNEEF